MFSFRTSTLYFFCSERRLDSFLLPSLSKLNTFNKHEVSAGLGEAWGHLSRGLIERFISYVFYFHNFDREGPGGADVYILCLEEFRSVGILPPGGSGMFRILPLAK